MPEAIAPANPAPAAAPVAVTAPASTAAPTPGVFDGLAFPTPQAKPAEAPAQVSEPRAEPTARLYADRFKSADDLEIAYRESSAEGLRLFQESRALNQQLAELQSKLAEAEERSKLGNVLPFKELTKEQFEKLESESPVKAAEYLFDKKLHDRDLASAIEKSKAQRESSERSRVETDRFIINRIKDLSTNVDKYPHYNELQSDMDAIAKRTGPDFQGKGWAPDVLYLVALGRKHLQGLLAGKKATSEAAGKTKAGAAAVASASAPGGSSPSEVPGGVDPNSDKAVIDAIVAAGNKPYF